MFKIERKTIALTLAIFFLIETLSFGGFLWPVAGEIFFIIFLATTLLSTIYKLEYGVLIVLAELFIGSFGHLFYLNTCGREIPIRIALWLVVMLVFCCKFLIQISKQKKLAPYWLSLKNFSGRKLFLLLAVFILASLLNGFLRVHSLTLISADFNAWLYFLLLIPLICVFQADGSLIEKLQNIFLAAVFWLSFKTLFLLFIFTHDLSIAPDIYTWLRKTLVGEMTPTLTGWPRIFIQGQIYSAIAFFAAFWLNQPGDKFRDFFQNRQIKSLLLSAWFLSAVLISFSRSFWVAFIGVLFLTLLIIWIRESFNKMVSAAVWFITSGIISFILIYLVVAFPYIHLPSTDLSSSFLNRVNSGGEAALASRWSLLPVLLKEIKKEPFLGQGYGATVTYFSRDPRILQNNPSGEYTTYAFEWGYLDLWLKLGILGLAAYLILIGKLVVDGFKKGIKTGDKLFFALIAGLLFLIITHTFTPYLNHPLGIGFLLISSCLIWTNRVY